MVRADVREAYVHEVDWLRASGQVELADAPGVCVGPDGRIYVLFRSERNPVVVASPSGEVLASLGADVIVGRPHGLTVGRDGSIYVVCDRGHAVFKLDAEGRLVWTVGVVNEPAPRWSGRPFCGPTGVALSPDEEVIYVSDGYFNGAVHKYTVEGEHVLSFGCSGSDPGEFVLPHGIAVDDDGLVYVADRQGHRVQVFDGEGGLVSVWNNLFLPSTIAIGTDGIVYVSEFIARGSFASEFPTIEETLLFGQRVSRFTREGELVSRIAGPGQATGRTLIAPHGVAVDSDGNVYVAEVGRHLFSGISNEKAAPDDLRVISRFCPA
jgi:DNA-binding beta-propeller fold protein YncE